MRWQFYPKLYWKPWHTKLFDEDYQIYLHYAGWLFWQFRWYSLPKNGGCHGCGYLDISAL